MIYCVEDDSSIRELMVYTLQASGFEACGFQDAAPFWDDGDGIPDQSGVKTEHTEEKTETYIVRKYCN